MSGFGEVTTGTPDTFVMFVHEHVVVSGVISSVVHFRHNIRCCTPRFGFVVVMDEGVRRGPVLCVEGERLTLRAMCERPSRL